MSRFGRTSPSTGMYENVPSSRMPTSSGRRQAEKCHANNENKHIPSERDHQHVNPLRRRPYLNETGQSSMVTGMNQHQSEYTSSVSAGERRNDKLKRDNIAMSTGSHSGNVPRFNRAKSEKREIVDSSWFVKSFADAGGLNQNSVMKDECVNQSEVGVSDIECLSSVGVAADVCNNSGISVAERKRMFESVPDSHLGPFGSITSGRALPHPQRTLSPLEPNTKGLPMNRNQQPHHRQQLPYRGSKTTPNMTSSTSTSDEWDFLATLNDILRRENFLVEDNVDSEKTSCPSKSSPSDNIGTSYSRHLPSISESNKPDVGHSNENCTTPTSPMSPRPPRPNRLRAERRKEYARTRSLDAGHFSLSNGTTLSNGNSNSCSHDFLGANSTCVSGNNIDLSPTKGNDNSGNAAKGSSGCFLTQSPTAIDNNGSCMSNRDIAAAYPFPVLPMPSTASSNKNGNNGTVSSCITVENPFHPSKHLSVLPIHQSLEYHGRQALVSPVKSSSTGNDTGGGTSVSNHFPHFVNNFNNLPPPPPNSIINVPHAGTPGERSITPRQQQQHPPQRLTTDLPNNSTFPSSFYGQHEQQQPNTLQGYRHARSPLLNTVSSSLDSIYERLKANDYLDPIGPSRPLTQVYFDRNFGYLDYGIGNHEGDGVENGFDLDDCNGGEHNSQPNLFSNSNGNSSNSGCGVVERRNFQHDQQNGNISGNSNAISCGERGTRVGRMSPFQPSQMVMGNVSPSMRLDRMAMQAPHRSLSRCGALGGSLSSLTGVLPNSSSTGNNSNITSAGSHPTVTTFSMNPASSVHSTTSWCNLPGDYRGRSYGSFKVIS